MRHLLTAFCFAALCAQAQTVYKVDINEWSRTNMNEVLEPGFTPWRFEKDTKSSTLDMGDGVTFVIRTEANMRGGWNKAFVQKKEYNCRLTGDGVNLDPDACGEFQLVIKGLAPGAHNIQTYHNGWGDPSNTAGWPITVKLNGQVVHQSVPRTMQVSSAQEATCLMTNFTVGSAGEEVVLTFMTSDDDAPADAATKKNKNRTPLLNGFTIDMSDATKQAKLPFPANRNIHVDADNGEVTLCWSPANSSVASHQLYLGTDSMSVAQADTSSPLFLGQKEAADTTQLVKDLYSMNIYYWRVDEVMADGTVCKGETWQFQPRHLAFPGAEGYGRYARGGRGGIVYHVTNLSSDNIPGSFLYGLISLTEPRTIVFDVSGIIDIGFTARFTSNVYIAAQTAPGKGICLMHSNINVGSESICRFLRARRGLGTSEQTGNAMGVTGADHCIIDHTTMSWGTDETFSSRGALNVTLQNSIISEALGIADHKNYAPGKNHGFAATIGGSVGTFSHNLLANCSGRNWSMGGGLDGDGKAAGELDMMNNVVYNWHSRTTDGGARLMQFVNNYYKMGPDTDNKMLFTAQNELGGHRAQFAYVSGNVRENKDHTLTYDKKNVTYNATGDYPEETWYDERFFPSYATLHSAEDAFKIVTSNTGATQPVQDDTDKRVIRETITGTYTYVGSRSGIKGEIDNEADAGGFELYPEETRAANYDTDQDGMPDWWEQLTGSDKSAADNNADPDHDGYTLLEDYLNFLAEEHRVMQPGSQATIDVAKLFAGFTKSPQFTAEETGTGTGTKPILHSSLFTLHLTDGLLTVKAGSAEGLSAIKLTVTDSEGTTYSRMLNIAVSGEGSMTAVPAITADDIISYELFDLSGRRLPMVNGKQATVNGTVYIMRATDRQGRQHTIKTVKQ